MLFPGRRRHCKLKYGFGTYGDVTSLGRGAEDNLPRQFVAETLK